MLKTFALATALAVAGLASTGCSVARDQQTVGSYVDDATITSHIKRIRKKFLAIDANFDEIETMHGAGYRWRA